MRTIAASVCSRPVAFCRWRAGEVDGLRTDRCCRDGVAGGLPGGRRHESQGPRRQFSDDVGRTDVLAAEFLRLGGRIDVQNANGLTPLHVAAFSGNPSVVKLLLAHGADRSTKTVLAESPCDGAFLGIQHFRIIGGGWSKTPERYQEIMKLLCAPEQAERWSSMAPHDPVERQRLERLSRRYQAFP